MDRNLIQGVGVCYNKFATYYKFLCKVGKLCGKLCVTSLYNFQKIGQQRIETTAQYALDI